MFTSVDLIVQMFADIIGSGYILVLLLVGVVFMALLAMRVHPTVAMIVLIPLIVGLAINPISTNLFNIPTYMVVVAFLIAGAFFAALFWVFIK